MIGFSSHMPPCGSYVSLMSDGCLNIQELLACLANKMPKMAKQIVNNSNIMILSLHKVRHHNAYVFFKVHNQDIEYCNSGLRINFTHVNALSICLFLKEYFTQLYLNFSIDFIDKLIEEAKAMECLQTDATQSSSTEANASQSGSTTETDVKDTQESPTTESDVNDTQESPMKTIKITRFNALGNLEHSTYLVNGDLVENLKDNLTKINVLQFKEDSVDCVMCYFLKDGLDDIPKQWVQAEILTTDDCIFEISDTKMCIFRSDDIKKNEQFQFWQMIIGFENNQPVTKPVLAGKKFEAYTE